MYCSAINRKFSPNAHIKPYHLENLCTPKKKKFLDRLSVILSYIFRIQTQIVKKQLTIFLFVRYKKTKYQSIMCFKQVFFMYFNRNSTCMVIVLVLTVQTVMGYPTKLGYWGGGWLTTGNFLRNKMLKYNFLRHSCHLYHFPCFRLKTY